MSQHARLSPSSAHRWMKCPGSIREGSKYPDTTSDAAIDGTHTHTLLEHCLKGGGNPISMIGINLQDHEGVFTVDQPRAERVQKALQWVEGRKERLGVAAVRSEEQINIGKHIGRDDMWGTADVQIIGQEEYEISDYKDGHTPVAADSTQVKLYAVGGMLEYADQNNQVPFKEVWTTIIQPKVSDQPLTVKHSPAELIDWFYTEVLPAANATDDPNAPLVPGNHCKYCNAAGNCSAQAEAALKSAQVMFGEIELAQQSADQDPKSLSDDKIREILEAKPLITAFLNDVEEEAQKRFNSGHPVTGLKQVYSGKGKRVWVDQEKVQKALKGMKVPKAQMFNTTLKSPKQIENLTWVNSKGEECRLTERQKEKLNNEFVSKGKGSKLIVPESDSRQSIHSDAASIFEDVQTDTLPDWLK